MRVMGPRSASSANRGQHEQADVDNGRPTEEGRELIDRHGASTVLLQSPTTAVRSVPDTGSDQRTVALRDGLAMPTLDFGCAFGDRVGRTDSPGFLPEPAWRAVPAGAGQRRSQRRRDADQRRSGVLERFAAAARIRRRSPENNAAPRIRDAHSKRQSFAHGQLG